MGATHVIAVNVGDLSDRQGVSYSMLGVAGNTLDAMMRASTRHRRRRRRHPLQWDARSEEVQMNRRTTATCQRQRPASRRNSGRVECGRGHGRDRSFANPAIRT